jgi:hypothetical protein
MSDSAANGADTAPLVAGSGDAPINIAWYFDHGSTLGDLDGAGLLALRDEGLSIDVLMAGYELVQVDRSHEEPFFSDDEPGDWSGTAHDAPRLLTLGGQAYDVILGGSAAENVHMLSDHPVFASWGEGALAAAIAHDLLVDLGHSALGGGLTGLAPFGGAIATHTDSSLWGGAIVADLQAPELSWLAAVGSPGGHVGEAWAWDTDKSAYVFHHFV